MKLSLVLLLGAITTSLTSVVTPAPSLQVELPDSRFQIDLLFDSPLLPVDPTLAIITLFISYVARSNFEQVLEPCTYSSRTYPTVTITSHSSTQTRFLLWGIYLAAIEMVKYIRFNDVVVNLLWNKELVGQISVLVNTGVILPSTRLNDTSSFIDDGEGLILEMISNKTKEISLGRLNSPTLESGTHTAATIKSVSAGSLVDTWNTVCSNPSILPTGRSRNASVLSTLAVDFQMVAGANRLRRNVVFLSFYAAMLHVAKFPVGDRLLRFDTKAPGVDLRVHMLDLGTGCSVILPTLLTPTANLKQMRWS